MVARHQGLTVVRAERPSLREQHSLAGVHCFREAAHLSGGIGVAVSALRGARVGEVVVVPVFEQLHLIGENF